ncbi:MAG: hypothetical protein V1744_06900 [Candidatus Altiarchaeota archaeon]
MEATEASNTAAYWVTAYALAYLLYLLVKAASQKGGLGYPTMPYDHGHIILRRKHIY